MTSCKDESKEKVSNSSAVQSDYNPKTLNELSEKNRQLIKDNDKTPTINSPLSDYLTVDSYEAVSALDRYFVAVNRLDKYAVYEACYPYLSVLDENSIPKSDGVFFIRHLGFEDSFMSNMAFVDHQVEELQAKSYGFSSYKEFYEARKNDEIERMLPDFEASYELLRIDNAANLVVYENDKGASGGWTREKVELKRIDPAEYISDIIGQQVEKVYIAQIQFYWQCGNMPYGNDPNWWNNTTFLNWIHDELGKVERYQTYDDLIKWYEKDYMTHSDTVLYKCNDEWYVFRDHRNHEFKIEWND